MAKSVKPQEVAREGFNEAVIGGRPGAGEFYGHLTSFGVPLSEDSRRESPVHARMPRPVTAPAEAPLPLLSVARAKVGHEVTRLRGVEAAIERELGRGAIGASGVPIPHLVERQRAARAELELVRMEIERLNNLDDNQVRQEAFNLGAR